jgi:hypothetical protein
MSQKGAGGPVLRLKSDKDTISRLQPLESQLIYFGVPEIFPQPFRSPVFFPLHCLGVLLKIILGFSVF